MDFMKFDALVTFIFGRAIHKFNVVSSYTYEYKRKFLSILH
jgi:hypothetical protein